MTPRVTGRPQWERGIRALRKFDADTLVTAQELRHYLGLTRTTYYRVLLPLIDGRRVRMAALWRAGDVLAILTEAGFTEGVR